MKFDLNGSDDSHDIFDLQCREMHRNPCEF